MTNFAQSLKAEIARVARKELRDELAALRKTSTAQRSEIATLKKAVKIMQSQMAKLAKGLLATTKPAIRNDVTDAAPARLKPGRKVLFTPDRLKNERARLGFTQEQMATLLGVSSLSIWKWESGGASPRDTRVPEILSRISMGKREAIALLENA